MTCECCQFHPIVQALQALLKTYSVALPDPRHPNKTPKPQELSPIKTKIMREKSKKKPKKQVISALEALSPKYNALVKAIEDGINILPYCQKVCLACSQTSDDDNLSRGGQTFVSIDAMASAGLADSGTDPAAAIKLNDSIDDYHELDPNEDSDYQFYDDDEETKIAQTANNYVTSHALVPSKADSAQSVTNLPSHIEDALRLQLKTFNDELDVFEKILVFSQMSGQTFADFGTMKWLPQEFSRPQSKQLISQRWAKIVQKFPIAAALQRSAPCKNSKSALAKHYEVDPYQQTELNLEINLNNEKDKTHCQIKW